MSTVIKWGNQNKEMYTERKPYEDEDNGQLMIVQLSPRNANICRLALSYQKLGKRQGTYYHS